MAIDGFDIQQDGSCVTIRVLHEDVTPEQFQQALEAAMERMRFDNAQHFVLDLAAVRYMPSASIGTLLEFQQEVEHCRGRIAIVHTAPTIAALFRITQLDEVFGLFDDVAEAVASFSPSLR